MKESIKSIIEWNEQTFGDGVTLIGQIEKFCEEKEEWLESDREDISELADLFIVAAGIGRFDAVQSAFYLQETMTQLDLSTYRYLELEKAIDAKMAKNRTRKWTAQNGSFQHVVE